MSVYPGAHFMVEDSDSHDEEEAGEKKENDPVNPPPPPPGLGTPPPPPGDFQQTPPPPPGFPELPNDIESISTEDSQTIDHEAARRMLLGIEEPNETVVRDDVSEGETPQESTEPEISGDEVEESSEEDQLPPPPGFSEEPVEEEEDSPPILDETPVESDISSIDSLADSLSLLEDE